MASPQFQFVPPIEEKPEESIGGSGGPMPESGSSTQLLDDGFRIRPPAPDPHVWGHLTRLERIARGAFGAVYRAWDTMLQREVALKLYGPNAYRVQDWYQVGLREARLLARIRHPHVVTVYGVDHRHDRFGIWMEFIRGRTLEALLRAVGPLGPREAALVGFDVCSAIAATHDLGLLHCDISAKNVMREYGGRIVLMDFGLGRDMLGSAADRRQVCGTPVYMAPELMRGQPSTVRSDIYSIGVLLYRLVTGRFPVEADSFHAIRNAHERGELTLLRDRRPDLPAEFLRIVEQALALDPAGRFATAGQLAKALTTLLCGA